MKKWIFILGLGIVPGLIFFSKAPVAFESFESKTASGQPVFNRIRFIAGWKQDIWLMQQSHQGFHNNFGAWDKLAIVVDKTKSPAEAKFYQLPETSDLNFENKPQAYKARCFACHANGPRAVRGKWDSAAVAPSLWGRLQVFAWNVRVKTYGHVDSLPAGELSGGSPFKAGLPIFSRPLGLKTCEQCHSPSGIRTGLKLEHAATAKHLVESGAMPPFPFKATDEEIQALRNFSL